MMQKAAFYKTVAELAAAGAGSCRTYFDKTCNLQFAGILGL